MHTREQLKVRLFNRRGRTIKSSVRKLRSFLRCHRTGKKRSMSWRLVRNIYRVSRKYKGKKILIYSAYRHRRVARLKTSKHIKGKAVDLAVQGVRPHELRDYLRRAFKKAGVGYYPYLPFVHFDSRSRPGFWVDVSGSGEGSRYSHNSRKYIRDERKYGVRSIFLLRVRGLRRGPVTTTTSSLAALVPEGLAHGATKVPPVDLEADPPLIVEAAADAAPSRVRAPAPAAEPKQDSAPARATKRPVQGPPPVGPDVAPVNVPGSSSVARAGKKVATTSKHPPTKRSRGGSKNTEGNRLAK